MRCLRNINSRFRSVDGRIIAFLVSAFIFFCGVHEGIAQTGKEGWTLRDCIEHARAYNLQVGYARVALENISIELSGEKAQRLPSLNFSTTQGWVNL